MTDIGQDSAPSCDDGEVQIKPVQQSELEVENDEMEYDHLQLMKTIIGDLVSQNQKRIGSS